MYIHIFNFIESFFGNYFNIFLFIDIPSDWKFNSKKIINHGTKFSGWASYVKNNPEKIN